MNWILFLGSRSVARLSIVGRTGISAQRKRQLPGWKIDPFERRSKASIPLIFTDDS
jgi:hypothetical protein